MSTWTLSTPFIPNHLLYQIKQYTTTTFTRILVDMDAALFVNRIVAYRSPSPYFALNCSKIQFGKICGGHPDVINGTYCYSINRFRAMGMYNSCGITNYNLLNNKLWMRLANLDELQFLKRRMATNKFWFERCFMTPSFKNRTINIAIKKLQNIK